MKRFFKQIIQWCLAIIVASLIMNIALGFYNRTTGWVNRTKCATEAIYYPNSSLLFGTEGRGYHKTDSRGYVNDNAKLADNYVLAVGSSYTKGIEVASGERYTDLLNKWLGYKDESFVYNVSQSANRLPEIIRGFKALISEFPKSSKIIIELESTSFDINELKKSRKQREYDVNQTGQNIMKTLTKSQKINNAIKIYSPLYYNINEKIRTIRLKENEGVNSEYKVDLQEYKTTLDELFKMITKMYDGRIIILLHPNVAIDSDGKLRILKKKTDQVFKEACEDNGILLVDMSNKFLEEYNKDYKVPYGFPNTSMARGHINKDGNKMIAEELLKYVK